MKKLFSFILIALPVFAGIPASRLTDWTPSTHTGRLGGIPSDRTNLIDVTQAPYNADNTGVADAKPAIDAAIAAAIAGGSGVHGVYLPAGQYRVDGQITLGPTFGGRVFRGAGMSQTIIKSNARVGLQVGSTEDFSTPTADPDDSVITAGLSTGSTTITVGSTANTSIGDIAFILFDDDDTVPVLSVYGYERTMCQAVRIVNKTATTFDVWPPLRDYNYPRGAILKRTNQVTTSVGVEDLTIDSDPHPSAYATACILGGKDCWFLRVRITKASNYLLILAYSLNCEVRQCWISDGKAGGSNGAGLLFTAWQCLVEDNVIYNAFPVVEVNGGSSGNVFGYNYGGENENWNSNHAPTNSYNLYEGNNWGFTLCDGYFGGQWRKAIFRNRNNGSYGINLRRLNRESTVSGNIMSIALSESNMGLPNLGNVSYNGTAQLSTGAIWLNYDPATKRAKKWTGTLSARSTDYAGVITFADSDVATAVRSHGDNSFSGKAGLMAPGGWSYVNFVDIGVRTGADVEISMASTQLPALSTTVVVVPSPDGFQERDLDVWATMYHANNYERATGTTSAADGDLPNSLYRSSKPDWFGPLAFPPYGPSAEQDAPNRIPAEIRFNGGETGGGGTTVQINGTLNVGTLHFP